jgi:hypothetical protein
VAPEDPAGRVEDGREGAHDRKEVVVANELLAVSLQPEGQCKDLKKYFRQKIGEKMALLAQNKAKFYKHLRKTPIFCRKIVENRKKM